jgi:hypothetical protein
MPAGSWVNAFQAEVVCQARSQLSASWRSTNHLVGKIAGASISVAGVIYISLDDRLTIWYKLWAIRAAVAFEGRLATVRT